MKVLDLVRLILGNLSRRKARVGLTAIGVVIGTAASPGGRVGPPDPYPPRTIHMG